MGILNGWKAAKIANAVEREIIPRMAKSPHLLFNYKTTYAWGTKAGNHIFDLVAQNSRKAKLSETDDFILALIYLVRQARADENPGGESGFKTLLLDTAPLVKHKLSAEVMAELMTL